jgi:hypothetical protein
MNNISRAFILATLFSEVLRAIAYSIIGEEERALASAFIVTGCYILERKFFSKKKERK